MGDIEAAKAKLTIPGLWRMLGLPGEPRPGKNGRSPFYRDRRPSFALSADGRLFCDHGEPRHKGDAINFLAIAKNLSLADATREFLRMAGEGAGPSAPVCARPDCGTGDFVARRMPADVLAAWLDGVSRLRSDRALQERLAAWRGWPAAVIAALADDALMAAPRWGGRSGIAFRVDYPTSGGLAVAGFHMRIPDRDGGRARWVYLPNESEHGHGVKAVPFVLGPYATARLYVVTEGQFDAICFALAAGWMPGETAWPDDVAVFGMRGAGGVGPFLRAYAPHWPKSPRPNALLLPDNDKAGKSWFDGERMLGETFADQLGECCRKVAVVTCSDGKDFNDSYRASPIRPADILDLLRRHGLADAKGAIL